MADEQEVHSITTAIVPLSNDQKGRETRYLWSMSLRTVCFILGVVTTGIWRWIFMSGAVFLPYFAVIIANAGRERGAWRGNGAFFGDKNELNQ
jgi:hypothetical protein